MQKREKILLTNRRQKTFYEQVRSEGTFVRSSGSVPSRAWAKIRKRIEEFQKLVNMMEIANNLHSKYLSNIAKYRVLDLGCGSGSILSLWLA
jgi:2-polyprenyl-3-methyl-5-hydroxy-6-metoxy-1,4-benzoquinol methylase